MRIIRTENKAPQTVQSSESDIWTQILFPPLPGFVSLGKSLNFSEPHISYFFFPSPYLLIFKLNVVLVSGI